MKEAIFTGIIIVLIVINIFRNNRDGNCTFNPDD